MDTFAHLLSESPGEEQLTTVLYLRRSDKDLNSENSIGWQRDLCDSCLVFHPTFKLVKVYEETGSAMTLADRPVAKQMLKDASEGAFRQVMIAEGARLARDPVDMAEILRCFERHNVKIYVATKGEVGGFILMLEALLGKEERNQTQFRVNTGKRSKFLRNILHNFRLPLGLKWELDQTGKPAIVIDEEKAKYVRYAFRAYVAGIGSSTITEELEKMGYRPPNGARRMSPTYINGHRDVMGSLLSNSAYCGLLTRFRTQTPPRWDRDGRIVVYPRDTWAEIEIPAIITPELWDLVQQRLAKLDEKERPSGRRERLFSQRIFCPFCKSVMVSNTSSQIGAIRKDQSRIQCSAHHHKLQDESGNLICTRSESFPTVDVEVTILRAYQALMTHPAIEERFRAARDTYIEQETTTSAALQKKVTREISRQKAKINDLIALKLDNDITEVEFRCHRKKIEDRVAELEASQEAAELRTEIVPNFTGYETCRETLGRFIADLPRDIKTINDLEVREAVQSIRDLSDHIYVHRTQPGCFQIEIDGSFVKFLPKHVPPSDMVFVFDADKGVLNLMREDEVHTKGLAFRITAVAKVTDHRRREFARFRRKPGPNRRYSTGWHSKELRARVVEAYADGLADTEIAERYRIERRLVVDWLRRIPNQLEVRQRHHENKKRRREERLRQLDPV